jgi:hypothetical protein
MRPGFAEVADRACQRRFGGRVRLTGSALQARRRPSARRARPTPRWPR